MSISKAQAAALAEGFLDNIGEGKEGMPPRNILTELFLLAGELIEDAQGNLNKSNHNARGKLSESLIADDPTQTSKTVAIDVLMNFYGAFINKGVKGTRSGSSTAGYSFRNEVVSRKMYKAIADWIENAKISTRSVKKYKGYGKHETRRKSIAQYDNTYAVARSIKQHGIKPSGFMDKAVTTTKNKVSERLGAALRIDIIDSLK